MDPQVLKEESKCLQDMISYIRREIQNKRNKAHSTYRETKLSYSPGPEDVENVRYYRQLAKQIHEEAEVLENIKESPYFARMDFTLFDKVKTEDISILIGKKSIYGNGQMLIHDWRSPIGQRYYIKNELQFSHENYRYEILLRRALEIKEAKLIKYFDEYVFGNELFKDGVADPFLVTVLREKRKIRQLTDIIKTIQLNQNTIIREPIIQNMIIQGCAGSGKTMILLHRLSYLLFNNPNIQLDSVKILTPNNIFDRHIDELAKSLDIDKIERYTVSDYYKNLLERYSVHIKYDKDIGSENEVNNDFVDFIYSDDFRSKLQNYYNSWYKRIMMQVEDGGILGIANKLGLESPHGRTYKEKIDDVYGLGSKIVTFQNENLSNIKKHKKRLSKLQDIIVSLTDSLKEEKDSFDLFIRANLSKKENWLDRVKEYEQKFLTIGEGIYGIDKLNSDINTLHTKAKHLQEEITQCENEIENCGAFSFFRKRKLKQQCEKLIQENTALIGPNGRLSLLLATKNSETERLLYEYNLTANYSGSDADYSSLLNYHAQLKQALLNDKEKLKNLESRELELKNRINLRELELSKNQAEIAALEIELEQCNSLLLSDKEMDQVKRIQAILPRDLSKIIQATVIPCIEAAEKHYNVVRGSKLFRFDLYAYLTGLFIHAGAVARKDKYLHIDEGQDLSEGEYQLLKAVNGESVAFNIYGDTSQLIKAGRGINHWGELEKQLGAKLFTLNENYRNTIEITTLCNKVFKHNITPIGINGPEVKFHQLAAVNSKIVPVESKGRTAIIVKDINSEIGKFLATRFELQANEDSSKVGKIDTKKISLLSTEMAKGLEFDAVIVIAEDMTDNEKYIAFTRALHELHIIQ